jgi:mxaJ protein
MSFRFSAFLVAGLACSVPVLGAELRVCAEPDNLPYSHQDESGFENRIARLLAEELKATLTYTWFLQRRAFVRKTAGVCEVFIGVPSDFERLLTTRPYYRSSYVFVGALKSFQDPGLKMLRIGVQLIGDDLAATPGAHALAMGGAVNNVTGFPVYGHRPAGQRIVEAIAQGELDAGVVWGPAAGQFAFFNKLPVQEAKAPPGFPLPLQFSISVGVRRGNGVLREALDAALERRRLEIHAVLDEYHVPRLP